MSRDSDRSGRPFVRQMFTFVGRVQGVGFRYTAVRLAANFQVTGWVRNQPNGEVRLVAEGEEAEIGRFIATLTANMNASRSARVDRCIADDSELATGEFDSFTVR